MVELSWTIVLLVGVVIAVIASIAWATGRKIAASNCQQRWDSLNDWQAKLESNEKAIKDKEQSLAAKEKTVIALDSGFKEREALLLEGEKRLAGLKEREIVLEAKSKDLIERQAKREASLLEFSEKRKALSDREKELNALKARTESEVALIIQSFAWIPKGLKSGFWEFSRIDKPEVLIKVHAEDLTAIRNNELQGLSNVEIEESHEVGELVFKTGKGSCFPKSFAEWLQAEGLNLGFIDAFINSAKEKPAKQGQAIEESIQGIVETERSESEPEEE